MCRAKANADVCLQLPASSRFGCTGTPPRSYCGYSFAGLSVIDAFLDRDPLCDAFLMIDPSWWWDDYVMEKRATGELASRKFDRVQLFIAASGEPYPEKYFIRARDVESLVEILRKTQPLKARYQAVSARLGERVALREDLLLFFGEQFLSGFNEPDQARRYYEMAAEAYPHQKKPRRLSARYAATEATQRSKASRAPGCRLHTTRPL